MLSESSSISDSGVSPGRQARRNILPLDVLERRQGQEYQELGERAVALTQFAEITVDDLPPKIRDYESNHVLLASSDPAELVTLDEVERRYIQWVMEAVSWSKSEVTRVLGIDRSTLYRKLDRYKIAPSSMSKLDD